MRADGMSAGVLKPATRLHLLPGLRMCGTLSRHIAPSKCLRGANKSNFSFTIHGLCSRREFNLEFTQLKYRFNLSECAHCIEDYNTSFSQDPDKPLFLNISCRSSKIVPYDNTYLLGYFITVYQLQILCNVNSVVNCFILLVNCVVIVNCVVLVVNCVVLLLIMLFLLIVLFMLLIVLFCC
jgi:hypothetical protein